MLRSKLAQSLDTANQGATPELPENTASTDHPNIAMNNNLSADKIVKSSVILAAGAGALPIPVWDTALIGGVQLKMLADLSAHYGVPFSENLGKSALGALLGGMAPAMIARSTVGSTLKLLPGIGSLLALITQPALAGVVTYALGRVFIQHYESGGTLLTFNATAFKENFANEIKAGMKKVSEVKI